MTDQIIYSMVRVKRIFPPNKEVIRDISLSCQALVGHRRIFTDGRLVFRDGKLNATSLQQQSSMEKIGRRRRFSSRDKFFNNHNRRQYLPD